MDIGKVSQTGIPVVTGGTSAEVTETTTQGQQQSPAVTTVDVGQDFQVEMQGIPQKKLEELAGQLQQRAKTLDSLPENVRKAVQELLQQFSVSQTDLSGGLVALLKSQKNLSEQLNQLANSLDNLLLLQSGDKERVQTFVDKLLQSLPAQQKNLPAQAGKELLQLAQQLADHPVPTPQRLDNLLQQMEAKYIPPKAMELAVMNSQKLEEFIKAFNKEFPQTLEHAAQSLQLTDLKKAWVLLKGAEMAAFRDMSPAEAKAAAQTLQAAGQWLKEIADTGGASWKGLAEGLQGGIGKGQGQLQLEAQKGLEAQLQRLPDSIKTALEGLQGQENRPEKLMNLAKQLETLATLQEQTEQPPAAGPSLAKGMMESPALPTNRQLQGMLEQLAIAYEGKGNFVATEFTSEMEKVLKQFGDQQAAATKLKDITNQLVSTLLPQETAEDSKNVQGQLNRLLKNFEPLPPALLETANKYNLPELPKLVAVLKALDAQQWQELDQQSLAKSSSAVKELAQQVYKPAEWQTDKQVNHQSLSFTLPIYFSDGTMYPAYIHLYQEKEERAGGREAHFETWLRISLETENLGTVNSVFRLYDDNKLDIRVGMPEGEGADDFTRQLSMVKGKLDGGNLQLTDFLINRM